MCGRYSRSKPLREYAREFNLPGSKDPRANQGDTLPKFNVTPGTCQWVLVTQDWGTPGFNSIWWGFVPSWWKQDLAKCPKPINAMTEGLATKPFWRTAFKHRRCLVPMDGFYEWRTGPSGKVPWFIRRKDGRPMGVAGVWDRIGLGQTIDAYASFAIVTVPPNDLVKQIHNRMPAILGPSDYLKWIDPKTPAEAAMAMLVPAGAGILEAYPVGTMVNLPGNDGPDLVVPTGPAIS